MISPLPPQTRALRRMIVVGMLAFIVGLFGVLFLIGWLMWRFVEPDTPWYDLLHIGISGLVIAVMGGLACAAGAITLLSWFERRREKKACERKLHQV